MDLPSTIFDLPFLTDEGRRNILGGNAQRLFKLDPVLSAAKLERRAARANVGAASAGQAAAAPA
jgi:hypothetical protein